MGEDALTKFYMPGTGGAEIPPSEQALIARLCDGDCAAAAEFLQSAIPPISLVIEKIEKDTSEQQAALIYVLGKLKEENYRRLRAFKGRARLATFLKLTVRELLAQRVADRLVKDPNAGWIRFRRIFDSDIRAAVARRFPFDSGTGRWEDLYQDICEKLVEEDFRRLRKYSGEGSFIGFVLEVVENLLTDMMRKDVPRQRLPAAIQRMPRLEQDVYKAIAWKGCAPDVARLTEFLRNRDVDPTPDAVRQALAQVMDATPSRKGDGAARPKTVSLDAILGAVEETASDATTPEEDMLLAEEEGERASLVKAVRSSAASLSAEEKLYLQLVFGAPEKVARRDIARLLGCSVADVDRLKQKTQRWFASLRQEFQNREFQEKPAAVADKT
jgi:RNA polymerase primary sigma factor